MTREQHIAFCEKCINRKMDLQQGLVCKLTNEKANFQDECPDFIVDERVIIQEPDDREGLESYTLKEKLEPEIIETLRSEQRFIPGILVGLGVGILGAILWAVITMSTGFQIGYMALAIGAGVGFSIRIVGNGIDAIFGYCGAVISFFSVLLGDFLGSIGLVANAENLGYFDTLFGFDYSYLPELMGNTFSLISIVFYAIAIFEGYKFSFRVITEKKMLELRERNPQK